MAGGGKVDGGLSYQMEIRDNVTRVAKRGMEAQKELDSTIKQTSATMQTQTLEFISNIMAITALEGGINALAESFTKLGIVSGENAEKMRKLAAATKLFTGTAQLIQGLIGVIRMLTKSEIILAGIETYRKVLHNPLQMAAVGLAAGAAGAAGGFLIGRSQGGGGSVNVTQNVNFNAPLDRGSQRSFARDSLEMMGG